MSCCGSCAMCRPGQKFVTNDSRTWLPKFVLCACGDWFPSDANRDMCRRCLDKLIEKAVKGIV